MSFPRVMAAAKTKAKSKAASKKAPATPARRRAGRAKAPPKRAAAKAKAAVGKAKAAGATGAKVTAHQRVLRDSAILACGEAGWSSAEIAVEFALTKRQVERIVSDRREMPTGLADAPRQILDELVRGYRDSIVDLELLAVRYRDDNPQAAIRAKMGAVETRERFASLLSAVGKLPENLELFRAESQLRQIADQMLETMELVVAGDKSPSEAAEFFRMLTEPPSARPALKAA